MARTVPLRKVGRVEKLAIVLLREAGAVDLTEAELARSVDLGPAGYGRIQRLVAQGRAEGLEVFSPTAPFVSEGERLLVGWIAFFQRDRVDDILRLSADWRATIKPCARLFSGHGLYIPYRSALEAAALTVMAPPDGGRGFPPPASDRLEG